jgi:hypothetical protein
MQVSMQPKSTRKCKAAYVNRHNWAAPAQPNQNLGAPF